MKIEKVDPRPAAKEIVEILHKHKIPLAFIADVFDKVREEIELYTIPYNPSFDNK